MRPQPVYDEVTFDIESSSSSEDGSEGGALFHVNSKHGGGGAGSGSDDNFDQGAGRSRRSMEVR